MRALSAQPDAPDGRGWLVLLAADNDERDGPALMVESAHPSYEAAVRAKRRPRPGLFRPPAPPARPRPSPPAPAAGQTVRSADREA